MGHLILIWLLLLGSQPDPTHWLLSQQRDDGGWSGGFDDNSGPGITAEAVLALDAVGLPIENPPTDFLSRTVQFNREVLSVGLLAKIVRALPILGADPTNFGGEDLIALIQAEIDVDGLYGGTLYEHCLAILAFRASDTPFREALVFAPLDEFRNVDGGWGFAPNTRSDTNTTATCLQARPNDDPALGYLRAAQNDDGGWPFQAPFATDTYSTALVILALNAADEDLADWGNPDEFLRALQLASGAFPYYPNAPEQFQMQATVVAIPALAGVP